MTEKQMDELEFIAVQTPGNDTVHVLRARDHHGWGPGEPGKTACGRTFDAVYMLEDIKENHTPCKLCERTLPVVAIMFETSEVISRYIELAEEHNEIMQRMSWITHGVHFGYSSPPYCQAHNPVPLTPDEMEQREAGEDPCIYVVRLYHGEDIMGLSDEVS